MDDSRWHESLEKADGYPAIFGIVKEAVESALGARRAGLMLGIAELGASQRGSVGAYYPAGSNMLVLNASVLKAIEATRPRLVKPFVFYVLLHEYLHSLGIFDEVEARRTAAWVSAKTFGDGHAVTDIAFNPSEYFPRLAFDVPGDRSGNIRLVKGFDSEAVAGYS